VSFDKSSGPDSYRDVFVLIFFLPDWRQSGGVTFFIKKKSKEGFLYK